jgi:hypothetical protein
MMLVSFLQVRNIMLYHGGTKGVSYPWLNELTESMEHIYLDRVY